MSQPLKNLTLELQVDRGREDIRAYRFSIDFHERPTVDNAQPLLTQVVTALIEQAFKEIEA